MSSVGIIGLGKMGKLHMKNCPHIDGIRVEAVADFSRKNLEYARSFGIRNVYSDYHELLNKNPKVDTVIICLPNNLHFECIKSALEAGTNVFTEKPIATTVSEAKEIVRLTKKSGSKFMVGHNMRFLDAVIRMKNRLEKGHIGDLQVLTIEEIINGPFHPHVVPTPVPEWWFDRTKSGGGVLLDLGYHLLDLYRYIAGDAKVVFCDLDYKYNLAVEDSAIVIVGSGDHVKGIINIGWYQIVIFPKYNFRLIMHGTSGYLSSEDLTPKNIHKHAIKEGLKNVVRGMLKRKIHPLSYTYFYESYFKEMKYFFDCIKNDMEPAVSAEDGLKTIKLVEDSYKSFLTKHSGGKI